METKSKVLLIFEALVSVFFLIGHQVEGLSGHPLFLVFFVGYVILTAILAFYLIRVEKKWSWKSLGKGNKIAIVTWLISMLISVLVILVSSAGRLQLGLFVVLIGTLFFTGIMMLYGTMEEEEKMRVFSEKWGDFAREIGCKFRKGFFNTVKIKGIYRGREIIVYFDRMRYSALSLVLRAKLSGGKGFTLELTPKSGARNKEIPLVENFTVRVDDKFLSEKILTPNILEKLIDLATVIRRITIIGKSEVYVWLVFLNYPFESSPTDLAESTLQCIGIFRQILDLTVDLAEGTEAVPL